jgi:hypothetical protein
MRRQLPLLLRLADQARARQVRLRRRVAGAVRHKLHGTVGTVGTVSYFHHKAWGQVGGASTRV